MTIRYTEVRNDKTWDGAADDIIEKLRELGVQQGQIISIDAHNNGYGEAAIMSAMWDDTVEGKGPLNIGYYVQNKNTAWEKLYANATSYVSTVRSENLISITGSCNEDDRAVLYVFYYHSSNGPVQKIQYCEARDFTWMPENVAKELISDLRNKGVKAGQIISIDIHNNGAFQDTIFHAFWNSSLPPKGDLDIKFSQKTDKDSWDSHYQWASTDIGPGMKNVLGVTSSIQLFGSKGSTFVFYENDDISEVKFFIDQGKIAETKPLTLATMVNTNCSDVEQEMKFEYEESVSNTSTFEHQAGVCITVGMEFSTGVPFITEGKISTEISTSYSHTWGTSTTTNKTGVPASTLKAAPHTKVTCKFRASKSILNVPYVIKLKSNRESRGTWKGVDVWNVTSEFTSEDLQCRA